MQDHIVIGGELQLCNTIDGDLALHSVIDGDAGIFMPIFPEAYAGPIVKRLGKYDNSCPLQEQNLHEHIRRSEQRHITLRLL